jgi:hypothetical protein
MGSVPLPDEDPRGNADAAEYAKTDRPLQPHRQGRTAHHHRRNRRLRAATGKMAGPDIRSQTMRILHSFKVMLEAAGSDLNHVVHVNVFLRDMKNLTP